MKWYHKIIIYPLRFLVQAFFYIPERITMLADVIALFLIKLLFKTEYVRMGKCKQGGTCCNQVGMRLPKSWAKKDWVVKLFIKWHYLRYNFEFLGQTDNMLVYKCHYLTKDNRCGIQRVKPKLCHDFPPEKLYGKPDLYENCGYYYVKRKALKFEEQLKKSREKRF